MQSHDYKLNSIDDIDPLFKFNTFAKRIILMQMIKGHLLPLCVQETNNVS